MLPEETKQEETSKGETPEEVAKTVTPTIEELQKKIDELTRHATNKEQEAARVRKKVEAFEQAEADRKKSEMSEIDRLKLEKQEADTRAETAANETRNLKLQIAFEDAADELEVVFASKEAAKDAYTFLDKKIVGDDGAGMKKAIEALQESKPYLFAESDEQEVNTDARQKGTPRTKEIMDKERVTELSSRFRIRKPR